MLKLFPSRSARDLKTRWLAIQHLPGTTSLLHRPGFLLFVVAQDALYSIVNAQAWSTRRSRRPKCSAVARALRRPHNPQAPHRAARLCALRRQPRVRAVARWPQAKAWRDQRQQQAVWDLRARPAARVTDRSSVRADQCGGQIRRRTPAAYVHQVCDVACDALFAECRVMAFDARAVRRICCATSVLCAAALQLRVLCDRAVPPRVSAAHCTPTDSTAGPQPSAHSGHQLEALFGALVLTVTAYGQSESHCGRCSGRAEGSDQPERPIWRNGLADGRCRRRTGTYMHAFTFSQSCMRQPTRLQASTICKCCLATAHCCHTTHSWHATAALSVGVPYREGLSSDGIGCD